MMKKLSLFFGVLCLVACGSNEPTGNSNTGEFIDLGLPSGTLWKNQNEQNPKDDHGFYTYDDAMSAFEGQIPNKQQCRELISRCEWTWTGNGYTVKGPNGNTITFAAAGYRKPNGLLECVGTEGEYWTSTTEESGTWRDAWCLLFDSVYVYTDGEYCTYSLPVRLIK